LAPSWLGFERNTPVCAHFAAHWSIQTGRERLFFIWSNEG
jgi:hypothetical protein